MTPSGDDQLRRYLEKRSPGRTPEPSGGGPGTGASVFVVQLHEASRRHYDLRLELGGVLMSWAVPKGISPDPADKRLAMHVEDHPVEYLEFEGVIPKGEYGAGEMIVWDLGRWIPLEDPVEGLDKGKLLFELRGYKLKGVWTLIRLQKGETGNEWLLIRERRGGHPILPADSLWEGSILSGLTVEQIREREGGWSPAAAIEADLVALGVRRERVTAGELEVMLAETGEAPFDDPAWQFELKLDGYRMVADGGTGRATLFTRNGNNAIATFPEIARALRKLPFERLTLDGELVVLSPTGYPSFQALQGRARLSKMTDVKRASFMAPASYFAFDLLGFGDFDLRSLPLSDRRRFLARLLPDVGPLRISQHFDANGTVLFKEVQRLGLEGIMAKRANASYVGHRSGHWLKILCDRRWRFVVAGYTLPKGSRTGFGALHLGVYDRTGQTGSPTLRYAGRVGTGFDKDTLEDIRRRLDKLEPCPAAIMGPSPAGPENVWVAPELVAEVRYKEVTAEGLLRQPSFIQLVEIPPTDCHPPPETGGELDEPARVDTQPPDVEELPLSNLHKVFWPAAGHTKGDLVAYYAAVAPFLLPFLADRPVVLTRYPDGIDGKSFFQKNAPGFQPEWMRTEHIRSGDEERETEYFVVDSPAALVFLANLGTIPLHMWASRMGRLNRPDWCLLDLDPKHRQDGQEVYSPFAQVVEVARAIRRLCEAIGLPTYPKTSGSSGIHVLIPLGGLLDYEQCRSLAQLLSVAVTMDVPDLATVTRNPDRREGKVYIDFVQNGAGRLVVTPYSVRARAGATVSTPLEWDEVREGLDMEEFTIKTVPERLERLGRDLICPLLSETPDLMRAFSALQARFES